MSCNKCILRSFIILLHANSYNTHVWTRNKWPNLITNVLGCEIIWPSLLFGVLGGIIGLFMDTSWYFRAVIAPLFWGIIAFYAGYTIGQIL